MVKVPVEKNLEIRGRRLLDEVCQSSGRAEDDIFLGSGF
ncbi:hypothetical protein D918_09167 [Trichuris suis]|nr:hypothetical protein D918_09167 [Trichuris suis]